MHRFRIAAFLAAPVLVAALALVAAPTRAQSCGSDCGTPRQPPEPPVPPWGPGPVDLTTANTAGLAASISGVVETCGTAVAAGYRIDCLRRAYIDIARSIPDTGDYRPIRQALLDAAGKLDAIVTANLDPTAPVINPHEKGRPLAGRIGSVRAVAPERLAAASRAAEKVIADTGMLILRSGEIPKRRTAHYQQIAAAMDGTMVVLRSS